jgi:hypothetical protein
MSLASFWLPCRLGPRGTAFLLCVVALVSTSADRPHEPITPVASPREARVVRLQLSGDVAIRLVDADSVLASGQATMRGFTLGSTNDKRRTRYRVEILRVGDTTTVRPAYREPRRAVGLSLQYEQLTHSVKVPYQSTVIVEGARRVSVNGQSVSGCSSRVWIRDAESPLHCVHGDTP